MVASLGSFYRKGVEDVAVTDGGTGASDAATALTNLNHDARDHTGVTGVGKVVQHKFAEFTGGVDIATAIPTDGTIPQNTEGSEILSITLTPLSSANVLVIEAVCHIGHSAGSGSPRIIALFKDADVNAVSASIAESSGADAVPVVMRKVITSPTTVSQVWRIRAGNSAGNARVNGGATLGTSPLGAGIIISSMRIIECAP